MEALIMILALLVAVIVHEIAHGAAALALGDPTARDAGRLSFNPLRHIDPVGSILLPLILVVTGSPVVFGWAKPVPISLERMRNPKLGMWVTALAGPASNLVQAGLAVLLLRLMLPVGEGTVLALIAVFLYSVVIINLVLMVLNMLPIPPLDGSRVVASLLPPSMAEAYLRMSFFGFIVLIVLLNAGVLDVLLTPLLAAVNALLSGASAG